MRAALAQTALEAFEYHAFPELQGSLDGAPFPCEQNMIHDVISQLHPDRHAQKLLALLVQGRWIWRSALQTCNTRWQTWVFPEISKTIFVGSFFGWFPDTYIAASCRAFCPVMPCIIREPVVESLKARA